MFDHKSTTSEAVLHELYVAEDSRAITLPMIGVAARSTMNDRRQSLTPSSDLSSRSSRLVGRLNNNLGSQFSSSQNNRLTFAASRLQLDAAPLPPASTLIPQEEAEHGRALGRRLARRPSKPPEYEQLKLPRTPGDNIKIELPDEDDG
jgi:hypothetical protein